MVLAPSISTPSFSLSLNLTSSANRMPSFFSPSRFADSEAWIGTRRANPIQHSTLITVTNDISVAVSCCFKYYATYVKYLVGASHSQRHTTCVCFGNAKLFVKMKGWRNSSRWSVVSKIDKIYGIGVSQIVLINAKNINRETKWGRRYQRVHSQNPHSLPRLQNAIRDFHLIHDFHILTSYLYFRESWLPEVPDTRLPIRVLLFRRQKRVLKSDIV